MPERRESSPRFETGELGPEYYDNGNNPDNEVVMSVYRHGDKTKEGALSEKGIEQAAEIGVGRKIIGKGVKGYHSPIERTKTMVETAIDSIPKNVSAGEFKKYHTRMRKGLGFLPFSKAAAAEWGKHGSSAAEWYFENYYDQPFDKDSLSAKEWAEQTASLFYRHIKMTGRLNKGSKINLEEASHGGCLDAFLADAFREQIKKDPVNPEGETIIAKMGGDIQMADQFQIDAKTDANGRLSAKLLFRGKKYPVNLEKLHEMSVEYQKRLKLTAIK